MKFYSKCILIVSIIFSSGFATEEFTKQELIDFVDLFKINFDNNYAPGEWKKEQFGWNTKEAAIAIQNEIRNADSLTLRESHRLLRHFFDSTKDYHCQIFFLSTEAASLPIGVKRFGDKYYISGFDESKINPDLYAMTVGDEILDFGGLNVADEVAEIRKNFTPNQECETDQSLAEYYFTHRLGKMGMEVPKGPILITCLSHETGEEYQVQLMWDYKKDKIFDHLVKAAPFNEKPHYLDFTAQKEDFLFQPALHLSNQYKYNDPNRWGQRDGFLPRIGEVVWESPTTAAFDAYIYLDSEGRQIGCVRIPHYTFEESEIEQLKPILSYLKENTEGLVVDQTGNCGGLLVQAYAVASMLATKPLHMPKQHLMLSQKLVLDAMLCLDSMEMIRTEEDVRHFFKKELYGLPVSYQNILFMRDFFEFHIDQWREGKIFTDPVHFYGWDRVHPHPEVHYDKPILFLINGLDFSCADFIPAVMQDNGRATLLGTKTSGAGGYVVKQEMLNKYGIYYFTLTGSLGIRKNGDPIENLGVTPEIPYELTLEDLRGGYRGYIDKIHESMNALLPKGPAEPDPAEPAEQDPVNSDQVEAEPARQEPVEPITQ